MSDATRLIALDLGIVAGGMAIVVLAGVPLRRGWLPTIVGLAPATGLAAVGMVAALGAMLGIDVRLGSTALGFAAVLVVALLVRRRRQPGTGSLPTPRSSRLGIAAELVLLTGLAILSVSIIRFNAATGLGVWDGWAMWGPKAHALFVEGDVWSPVFTEPSYLMQHQEYPILLPALEALSAGAIGRFDPALVDIQPAAVLVAFGWGTWAILRAAVNPVVGAAVALAVTGSGKLIENAGANYADSVVASFTALGVLCLLVWLTRGATATLVLASLFLGAAASTKAEGLLFVVAAIVAAAATARGLGRQVRSVLACGAAALALPLVWAVVDRANGPGAENIDRAALGDPDAILDASGRIPMASSRLFTEIVEGWPLASLAVAAAILAAVLVRLVWPAVFVGLWALLALSALVAVYYASTAPIDWLLLTSADRAVYSIPLGLVTTAPILVGLAWERLHAGSDLVSRAQGRARAMVGSPGRDLGSTP